MRIDLRSPFLAMSVFYIAMAFLESAVVVYLRAIHYQGGFAFPLVPMEPQLVLTETLREAATMIMLLTPAVLVTPVALERFAWFCFGFGVWDLFYYAWLKVLIGWPEDLLTWDLLFLIPMPWVGPVWAPCVVSIGLVALGITILYRVRIHPTFTIDSRSWALMILGAVVILISFMFDPFLHGLTLWSLSSAEHDDVLRTYSPQRFPLVIFLVGSLTAASGVLRCAVRRS